MSDFPYLHKSTIPLLELSDADRILYAQTKRWIPYAGARAGYDRIERLLQLPRQQRPENLLIVAPTSNGKSSILERFQNRHPASDNPEGECAFVPVLSIEVPDVVTLDAIYSEILSKLFSPPGAGSRIAQRREQVFIQLKNVETRILLIDEVHNVMLARRDQREGILAFLRGLGNQLLISIVAAGTVDARQALQADPQLLNRFDIHRLPVWVDSDGYRQLLASFESLIPLRSESGLAGDDKIAAAILSMSQGLIGEMFKIISRAAVLAIASGTEAITLKVLSKVDYESPQARRVSVSDGA